MTDEERKAWEEGRDSFRKWADTYKEYHARRASAKGGPIGAFIWADAELKRLREALACTSENCSEFGRYHDGDCSECPQGTIRARAGLASKEGTSAP